MNEAEVARLKAELVQVRHHIKHAMFAADDASAIAGPFKTTLDDIQERLDNLRYSVEVMLHSIKPSE